MITFSSDLFTGHETIFWGLVLVAEFSGGPNGWAVSRSLISGKLSQLVGVQFSSRDALFSAVEAALKINPPNQQAADQAGSQLNLF